ncbi:imidazoleglycerol-phosphate dehydratase/histidinol-phosphatase [Lewinella marina]|uniref:Histidine biosynthesis bifunctional protein HisB n=1 Tax=Neolewinella marina TaxID=438751 RepID=A0A2G0CC60_9BACT|nr:bifunctional histidinol-phosphatase/imidazoleglycerol-phosphate dehydratase HisB [Neolewinella marina]NJB86725.1 imidazoleglycerol-phosphate dehydratase/histidinol-phosphatase [Neolewinella marina]PHK97532.1 bifunctional histidinol-phosphatase/imidazoleglycerol-phosphate dehydratase [Neolewinella marina]
MPQKILFLDRDGTLILEPEDYQVDSVEKLNFYPGIFRWLGRIVRELDYQLVMITNQDGLGTQAYPEDTFWPPHELMRRALAAEGVEFVEELIDRTYARDNAPTRKPNVGLVQKYLDDERYDIPNSYVIGDRLTDMQLAKNMGARGFWLANDPELGNEELSDSPLSALEDTIALRTTSWKDIYRHLRLENRTASVRRTTKETDISITLDLDGTGTTDIQTGLGFFDHMLDQLGRHSGCDLTIQVEGDLDIDEHHTIEDTAIALGEVFAKALGDKLGIERYGFYLPMDDALAQVGIDFGGRPWLVWDCEYRREKIGDMPTEMFYHFFKSFTDGARCNLNIKVEGDNEHHKIEATFKALAKSIKMAKRRDVDNMRLPSTKGVL